MEARAGGASHSPASSPFDNEGANTGSAGDSNQKTSTAAGSKPVEARGPTPAISMRRRTYQTLSTRKSCDFCYRRKKRCDGDGVSRCSFCIVKGQEHCVYNKRRSKRSKGGAKTANGAATAVGTEVDGSNREWGDILHRLERRRVLGNANSLKRCHWSASPATGLVGMAENALLGTFFRCMGFMQLVSESVIRQAMVRIMISSSTERKQPRKDRPNQLTEGRPRTGSVLPVLHKSRHDDDKGHNDIVDNTSSASVYACISMLWSAVALGGLVQGRSMKSVTRYIGLAEEALALCAGVGLADIARAHAAMGLVQTFSGGNDTFSGRHLVRAGDILRQLRANDVPQSLDAMVRCATDAEGLHGLSASAAENATYCEEDSCPLRFGSIVTEGDILQFVFQSDRRLTQAMMAELAAASKRDVCRDEDDQISPDPHSSNVEYSLLERVSVPAERSVEKPTPKLSAMATYLQEAAPHLGRLADAAKRPEIGTGIGGFMINCSLVMMKEASDDKSGALECTKRCVEVLVRYPGLCNMTMGVHAVHVITLSLAVAEEREAYSQLREAYNAVKVAEDPPIPPLEERRGLAPCNHYMCRSTQRSIEIGQRKKQALDCNLVSSCDLQDRAARPPYLVPTRPEDDVNDDSLEALACAQLTEDGVRAGETGEYDALQPNSEVFGQDASGSGLHTFKTPISPERYVQRATRPDAASFSDGRTVNGECSIGASSSSSSYHAVDGGMDDVNETLVSERFDDEALEAAGGALGTEDWLDVVDALFGT